ncbi:MAG: hypothetical protein ACLGSD_18725 [Acidobacteriota bacterium]
MAVSMLPQAQGTAFAQQTKAQVRPAAAGDTAATAASGALDPAQAEWKKQSAQLLMLATQLKQEVDKTTENILSLKVIEKAREIERFTHATQQQLKAQN